MLLEEKQKLGSEIITIRSIVRVGCHVPFLKIRENGVAMRVGDVYTQGEYPMYTR